MNKIKCITFDKEAQNNLPKWVKAKMQKDRKEAQDKQLILQGVSKSVICDYCKDTGWDSYPNHDTTPRPCPECQP